jgi:chromosome partitioning protein
MTMQYRGAGQKGCQMRVWSLVSQKGGAGKSTLATQLAVAAWQGGEKVAIIDVDRQYSAWHWGELRKKKPPEIVRSLPERLNKVIEAAEGMGHTLVIVDTAPHTDGGVLEAIKVADLVIVPTKPAEFELAALKDTVDVLDLADRRHLALGVINGVATTKAAASEFAYAAGRMKELGLNLSAVYLSHRKAFTDAIAAGMGVTEGKFKRDKAAQEISDLYSYLLRLAPPAENVIPLKEKA